MNGTTPKIQTANLYAQRPHSATGLRRVATLIIRLKAGVIIFMFLLLVLGRTVRLSFASSNN